jgi:hypothetical protein
MRATGRVPSRQARGLPPASPDLTELRGARLLNRETCGPIIPLVVLERSYSFRPLADQRTLEQAITKHLRNEIDPIAVGRNPGRLVKTLSIEARTAETAEGLRNALAIFNAEVIEQYPETFVVRVDLSPYGGADINSVLSAIQQYVAARQAGSALIDLDGRSYMMEGP